MHTQGHAIFNVALLGGKERRRSLAALAGAIVPDLMIVFFYLDEKFRLHVPDRVIWGERYFSAGFWQTSIDAFHSFPLAIAGYLIAKWRKAETVAIFFLSLIFHSLLDFPVHQEDAHAHLFPFSRWKWRSPVSYWNPRAHGLEVFAAELALVALGNWALWRRGLSPTAKVALVLGDALYVMPLLYLLHH